MIKFSTTRNIARPLRDIWTFYFGNLPTPNYSRNAVGWPKFWA